MVAPVMNRQARRIAAKTAGQGRPGDNALRPVSLEPEWQRWLAENLLLGAPADGVQAELVAKGCPPAVAAAEIAAAQNSPYFRAAAVLQARLAKRDWLLGLVERHAALDTDATGEVTRRDGLAPETFLKDHYAPQRPVVLTGLIDHWPAMRRWSLDHFAALPGDPEIEVQSGRDSDANYEINCRSHSRRMPLSAVLAMLRRDVATNDFYVTANNGGHNRAALAPLWDEIGDLPGYLSPEEGRDGFFWMGPRGTVTPWHHDLTNNFLVQIRGTKQVTLVSPAQTPLMRNTMHCYSVYNGDATFAGAPEAERPRTLTCTLGPGEILFIPVGWWHHVVGLETTIGLSFTNFVWDNEAFRGYTTYHQV